MPIYEYQCKACDSVTDFLQKMSDAPMLTCPECNADALKKLISAPRFRLAGSGWYETDFKEGDNKRNLVSSDDKKSETKKDQKSDTESGTKSENKSENKSAEPKNSDPKKANSKKTETKSTQTESKAGNTNNTNTNSKTGNNNT